MITESKSWWLHKVRFEFLLLALMMVLFNTIFVFAAGILSARLLQQYHLA